MKIIDQHVLFFVLFFFGSVLLNKTVEAKVRGGATVVGTVRMNGGAVNPNLERIQVSFELPIYTTEMSDRKNIANEFLNNPKSKLEQLQSNMTKKQKASSPGGSSMSIPRSTTPVVSGRTIKSQAPKRKKNIL